MADGVIRASCIALCAGVIGCFSPSFPDGALVCGEDDACPPGLSCFDGLCARQMPPGDSPDASLANLPDADPDAPDAAPGSPDAAAPDAAAPQTFHIAATVAACTSPDNPNPNLCESSTGSGEMAVDGNDSALDIEFASFLRFSIPSALANRTVTSATLVLYATDNVKADGPSSGEVWLVEAFDAQSLFSAAPAKVGTQRLSPDQGAVDQNDTITWPLPSSVINAGQNLHLGVFALNDEGVNYWNNSGDVAPELIVDAQ